MPCCACSSVILSASEESPYFTERIQKPFASTQDEGHRLFIMDQPLPTILELQVVTPERPVISSEATAISLPGKNGRLGILPGHAPLVSELAAGVLFFEHDGATRYLAVSGGFAEVLPGRVIVLAQAAERAEDIDVEKAQRAKQQAEEQLKRAGESESEQEQARAALDWSSAQIEAAQQTARA